MNPFKRTYTASELEYIHFLSQSKLFEKLNRKEMLLFLPYMHLRTYKLNEVVFFRNDPSRALYLIRKGEITLKLDVGDHFETITRLSDNASIGNNCLIKDSRRIFNAIVSSPICELYVIPQVNILAVFESRSSIKAKMIESFGELMSDNFNAILGTYQSSHGFFDLEEMFRDLTRGC